jgi:hypothetical protein
MTNEGAAIMLKNIACTIGNAIIRTGIERSAALLKAWSMSKNANADKVVGVTVGNRQEALKRLALYGRDQIRVSLIHESGNPVDGNAVAVIVEVVGKGSYRIGYIAKETAALLARVIDKVGAIIAAVQDITGGTDGLNAGLNISYRMGGAA